MARRFLHCFLGAVPCTAWLPPEIATDAKGYVPTTPQGSEAMLEMSVPGDFATGDLRASWITRCATAIGDDGLVASKEQMRLEALQGRIKANSGRRSGL